MHLFDNKLYISCLEKSVKKSVIKRPGMDHYIFEHKASVLLHLPHLTLRIAAPLKIFLGSSSVSLPPSSLCGISV